MIEMITYDVTAWWFMACCSENVEDKLVETFS